MKTGRKTKAQLVKELEALRKITATIGNLLNLNTVLQRIIDEMISLFAAQAASVILFDDVTQEAEITTAYGMQTFQGKPLRYPWRGSLSGWVAEHKRSLRLSHLITEEWPTSAQLATQLGGSLETISVLLAPLWQNGAVIGCLEMVWDPQRDITDSDEQLLETIATQVAVAITNTKIYQEKEQALQEVRESESRFRQITENFDQVVWLVDAKEKVLYVSPAFEQVWGRPCEQLYQNPSSFLEAIYPEDRPLVLAVTDRQKSGESFALEYRIVRPDGTIRWLHARRFPVRDEYGVISRYAGVAEDITERKKIETALCESEERYRDLVDNSKGLICTHDLNGGLLSVNPTSARELGYQPHELIGRNLAELVAPSVRHLFPAYLAQFQQETSVRGLLQIMTRAGEERVLAFHNILRTEPGRDPYVVGHAQDITERVRAESALRESEEKFRQLAENIHQVFWVVDLKADRFIYVSPAYEAIWGRSCESLYEQSRSWQQDIHPEDKEKVLTLLVRQRLEKYDFEFRIIRPDGALRWVWVRGFLVQNKRGQQYRRVGIIEDITERKRAGEALQESEERTRSIIEAALDAVISIDEDGQIIGWNPQAEHIFGWPREEVMGHYLMDVIIPVQYRAAHQHGLQCFMQTGAGEALNKRIEVTALHRNGTEFPVELTILPVRWKERWTFTAFVRDISEQKQAQQALRDSEERYRNVSSLISDCAYSYRITPDGLFYLEWLTESFARMSGYELREFFAKPNPWTLISHPDDAVSLSRILQTLTPGAPTVHEFRIIRKDRELRWLRGYSYVLCDAQGTPVQMYGAAQDITEQKRAEETLQYQLAFEQLIIAVSKHLLSLAPAEIERGLVEALQTVGKFAGVDSGYLFRLSHQGKVVNNTHEWCAQGIEPIQSRLRNLTASRFPWLRSKMLKMGIAHVPDVDALPAEAQEEKRVWQAAGIQSVVTVPIFVKQVPIGYLAFASVRTKKAWSTESLPLLKVVGEIMGSALERQEADERQQQLQAQLLQTQKLEAVGTLAGGIAHDFNNILTAIMGYTELVTDDVPDNSLARRNLEAALMASRRARGLIQQLLTFSRPSRQDRHPIQLHEIVEDTLILMRASLPKNITLRLAGWPQTDTILADPTQIGQVIVNLCVNAAYAIGADSGVIDIEIDAVNEEHDADPMHLGGTTQPSYCLTISDDGCGVAPEILEHVFDPFFTTKPVGHGSGMGLAIVHGIVTSHGGRIAVESQLGQGTTFRLYFPPCRETVIADGAETIPSTPGGTT